MTGLLLIAYFTATILLLAGIAKVNKFMAGYGPTPKIKTPRPRRENGQYMRKIKIGGMEPGELYL